MAGKQPLKPLKINTQKVSTVLGKEEKINGR
jgi:hypothetical protein